MAYICHPTATTWICAPRPARKRPAIKRERSEWRRVARTCARNSVMNIEKSGREPGQDSLCAFLLSRLAYLCGEADLDGRAAVGTDFQLAAQLTHEGFDERTAQPVA